MSQDIHQQEGSYPIRSVYFDDAFDRCMEENEAGVDQRKKIRIRSYDPAASEMKLEIKEKNRGLTRKTSCLITREECLQLLRGQRPQGFDQRAPLNLLKLESLKSLMRPVVLISYDRTAYVYPVGNVRVTFDRNITAAKDCSSLLAPQLSQATPVLPTGVHILEVKYDELLPPFIGQLLELGSLQQIAFSKYYLGRLALRGEFPVGRF